MLQPHALNESQGLGDYTLTISSGECKNDIAPAFYHSAEEQVFVRAVMASESDLRMFVQQGAFTIHPTNMALDKMQLSVEILRKFIIPAECCYKMAAELAVAGFRRGDIYPDLQNLSDDLRSFAPRLFR